MNTKNTLPAGYFNDVYRDNTDPWNFETSPYEKAKYEATINALPKKRYDHVLEIGCSIGVLTSLLAQKCNALLATDISAAPIEKAKKRLQNSPNVTFQIAAVPEQYPNQPFSLVVMSEVGYYLSKEDLQKTKEKIVRSLVTSGDLILVHWLPFVPDYPLTGDEVHELFLQPNPQLTHLFGKREEKYRLDVFRKL